MSAGKNLAFGYLINRIEKLFEEKDVKKRHDLFLEFVEERSVVLEKNARIKKISIKENNFYSGFIHPESAIIISKSLVPFQINDDEVYVIFLEKLFALKNFSFKNILIAVTKVIEEYFGDNWLHGADKARLSFFEELESVSLPISLEEFKHKNIAECAEKATLAQNLLIFLGLDSKLIISKNCQLDHSSDHVHAFNIIKYRDNEYIFDPTNPQLIFDEKGDLLDVSPACYLMTTYGFRKLKDKSGVEVFHQNLIKKQKSFLQKDLSYRIYSA